MKKGKKYNLAILALAGLFSLGGCAYNADGEALTTTSIENESENKIYDFDLELYVNELLENKNIVDYDDLDYRFLVYLYTIALSNTSFEKLQLQSDNDCFAYALVNNVDSEFIENYKENQQIDYDMVMDAVILMNKDIDYIKVCQEANICLRSDLSEGKIDGVAYNNFLFDFVSRIDEETYNEWYSYHEDNSSMYEDGKLFEKVIALK